MSTEVCWRTLGGAEMHVSANYALQSYIFIGTPQRTNELYISRYNMWYIFIGTPQRTNFLFELYISRYIMWYYIYRGISCGRVSTPHMTTFTSILLTQSIYRWRHNGFRELCQSLIIFIGTPQRANFLFELYMSRYIMWQIQQTWIRYGDY